MLHLQAFNLVPKMGGPHLETHSLIVVDSYKIRAKFFQNKNMLCLVKLNPEFSS